MVLHRLSATKQVKLEMAKSLRKKNKEVKDHMEPAHRHSKEELKKTSERVCRSVGKTMSRETREQAPGLNVLKSAMCSPSKKIEAIVLFLYWCPMML